MNKLVNRVCPEYFDKYVSFKDKHKYRTRVSSRNQLVVPKCRAKSGLRTFHTSGIHLWNLLDSDHRSNTNYIITTVKHAI